MVETRIVSLSAPIPVKPVLKVGIVVHRFPPFLGGCEFYAYKLAEGLTTAGHDVTVYTTRHHARMDYNFKVREFKNINPPGSGYFFWPAFLSPSVLTEIKGLDILHAFDFSMYATFGALMAAKLCRVPLVVQCSYHPPESMPHSGLKSLYDKSIGRMILAGSDAAIIQCYFELAAMEKHVNRVKRDKLYMISPGPVIDTPAPSPGFRETYGLKNRYVVLYVGRIDANKGTQNLFDAVKLLEENASIRDLALVIVGDKEGWYEWPKYTVDFISSLGDKVVLTGRLDDESVAAAYAESDIAVVPSRYESFGFTIIEALSYGTPVVATRVGIAPEVIVDGHNGYLYDFGDVKGLADSIIKLSSTARGLRSNAAKSVSRFTWDRAMSSITDIYHDLVRDQA